MNTNVKSNEYHFFLDNMFYMYTRIAQYLRIIFETNNEIINDTFNNENLIQLITLLAYFPENESDRTENFWQTKINLSHLIMHISLQQTSPLINNTIVQHASQLFSKILFSFSLNKLYLILMRLGILNLPLQVIINGSISTAISIMLQLLALSIAQCVNEQDKENWKTFFDQSSIRNGKRIFNHLLNIYENRLNTESNDTLKLTVSNMIKSLLNISKSAKEEAIESKRIKLFQEDINELFCILEGFIESQIDHLKRIQTKLTLFSLQSDKCVSKV